MINEYKNDNSIDDLFKKLSELKEYNIITNYALTAYDKQQYKEMLDKLELNLYELKEKTQPRKKFAFSKKNNQLLSHQDEKKEKKEENNLENSSSIINFASQIKGIMNLSREIKKIGREEHENMYKIENNNDSEIEINAVIDCIFIKNNNNCIIRIGPVKSSVFIDNNENCDIHIMGHQVISKQKI